ncbi:MAG: DUF5640 domain-containing protein [Oscillospiraceae bacterium]|nr:DUF5640 domain-containing protein [Oscillospiraceae bacterium]
MRRFFTGVLVLLMAAGMLMAFTGCGNADPELVGTWGWDVDNNVQYVFNADGTGNRGGFVEANWNQSFNWLISSTDILVLTFHSADVGNEMMDFTISDNTLNLVRRDDPAQNFNYIRMP